MAQTVAVVRNSLPFTSVGETVDFTKSGFGTPDAAILIFDNSNTGSNPQANSLLGVGFWDRTNQRGVSAGATDASATTVTYRSSDDSYGVVVAGDGANVCAYTVSDAPSDGIRLTLSVDSTGAARYCTVLLLKGVSAKVGTFTPNSTQNATQASASLGFAPELIFFCSIGNNAADTAGGATCLISFGFAAASGPTHRNLIHALSDAQGAEVANVHFSTTRCVGQSSGDVAQWAGEVTTFGSDTFTMTTRDGGSGGDVCFFLALGGADLSYDTGTLTSRTTTGDDVNSTVIKPAAILVAFSTAASTSVQTAASGANSLMFGMGDVDGQFSHNMSAQDAGDPTDNNSRSTANKLISLDTSTGGGPTLFIEGTVAFNASDFTINYPTTVNGTARLGWWVVFANASATNYSLTMSAGAFTLSGQAANTLQQKKLAADKGTFILSGQDATLTLRRLAADAGDFTLTGRDANLLRQLKVVAATGAFVLTGQDVSLQSGQTIVASSGSFTLTGRNANLLRASRLSADAGAFTLTGRDANLLTARRLAIDAGVFVLSGQDVTLRRGRTLAMDAGAFTLSGQAAGLRAVRLLAMGTGTFTFTGIAATFSVAGQSYPAYITLTDEALAYVTLTDFALATITLSDVISP